MKNKQHILLLLLLISLFVTKMYAQLPLVSDQEIDFSNAVTTISSGNWSDSNIWSTGIVPNATADVIINDGHTVYIDIQGSVSNEIVDLCRNLQIKNTAILQMGHSTDSFAKDLRINGSMLCNGTFSAGRNQPEGSGDGAIYVYNSRIYMALNEVNTYISGAGYFNPKSLNISSDVGEKNIIIDLYNIVIDDSFAIKSNNRIQAIIKRYSYVNIKKNLGLTGSTYQFSSPSAKADLTIEGVVIAGNVSLFTKNTTSGETSSITINNQGSLYTNKINNGDLDVKTEAAGYSLTINQGGLFRLGKDINFQNLTQANQNFVLTNTGEIREHYSQTISSKAEITTFLDQFDPNLGADVAQIKDVFGATHIAGWYNFTDRPYLLEGLDYYKEFGATSVKTSLSAVNGRMFSAYPFNHTWPNFQTLKEVAQHKFIDSLFQRKHIKTHTFWTTTKNKGDYKKGPDFEHTSYINEEQQFYDLTKYLLEKYGAVDKTFVYQNWEGDWMLRGQGVLWENDPSLIPDNVEWTIEGMARMFRARQRGTERARNEFPSATAKVLHGIEFNKLWMPKNGNYITMMDNNTPSVIADVVPRTRLDLTSWSAYDGIWTNTDNPDGHAMWKGIEMASYFTTETGKMATKFPVQIGEFAINENPPYNGNGANTEPVIRVRYGRYIGLALGLNIPNFYLWNLYGVDKQGPADFTWEKGVQYNPAFSYEWMVGKWLLEPDGTWGHAANFLMEQWSETLSSESYLSSSSEIVLYPNPSKKYIRFKGLQNNSIITIANLSGKIIKQLNIFDSEQIDLSFLSKGVYFVKIQQENQPTEYKKLLLN